MFSEKYLNEIKGDRELTALRKEFYDLTGKSASVELMNPSPIGEWKKKLKDEVKQLKEER